MKENVAECGFYYTLSLISSKYKMSILYLLSKHKIIRYNELKRMIGEVSFKSLIKALKELESDDLIIRTKYPAILPKIEYKLSEKGAN